MPGDRRIEQRLAATDRLERGHEVARPDLLEEVAAGAGDDRGDHRLLVGVAREHHHPGRRELRPDLPTRLDPRAVGQPDVHDDEVRLEPPGHLDRLGDRARLGDDLEPRSAIEHGDQALADDLVVVDDQERQRLGSGRQSWRGDLLVVAVPSVGRWIVDPRAGRVALDVHGRTNRCHPGAHVGETLMTQAADRRRVEAVAVVLDPKPQAAIGLRADPDLRARWRPSGARCC